jgi:Domain of unknown function (DUF4349)
MLLEDLERELRAERPEPDREFARRLDDWAAAGFPRGDDLDPRRFPGRRGPVAAWLRGVRERLATTPPRRVLAPVAAALTLVVVASVAVTREDGMDGGGASGVSDTPSGEDAAGALEPAPSPMPGAAEGAPAVESMSGGDAATRADELAAPQAARDIGPAGRRQAQRVDITLATSPEEFRDAADGVLDVVRDHRAFVVRSSVRGGDPELQDAEPGNASFQLRIPAVGLQSALAALSDLGHVVSRTDGTVDITSRFTSAERRIEELTRERERLLEQLEDAETRAERRSIRAQLRIVAAGLTDAEDDLARAQNRVRMVPVSVSITADTSVDDGGGSSWGIDDAADDALDVLRFAGGVALVSAAVLVPIALIGIAAWVVATRARARARERALDSG